MGQILLGGATTDGPPHGRTRTHALASGHAQARQTLPDSNAQHFPHEECEWELAGHFYCNVLNKKRKRGARSPPEKRAPRPVQGGSWFLVSICPKPHSRSRACLFFNLLPSQKFASIFSPHKNHPKMEWFLIRKE